MALSTREMLEPRRMQEDVSFARVGFLRASDMPMNHKVLYGARVAAVSQTGMYAGFCGNVAGIECSMSIKEETKSFSVRYEIRYDNAQRQWIGPLRLFRTCAFLWCM
jgi:hypothetical protein